VTRPFSLLPDGVAAHPALLDDNGGEWVTYASLRTMADDWANRLSGPRSLVFLYIYNDVANVASLLGAIAAGHAVALFDPNLSQETRARLEARYRPDWVVGPGAEQTVRGPLNAEPVALNPELSVLLSTSGSTGSPKLVRLSWSAIEANARGIAEVLDIESQDVAAGHLPLHYSYGLSVLTSHLCRGAGVRLTGHGLMQREFWPALREAAVTHLPGVPFHYQVMSKLGFGRLGLDSLRTMTQAGGALDVAMRHQAHDFMSKRGGAFYVLYGQTEAAPRMTTLQHADFLSAASSVGTPLPGCRIEIGHTDENGTGEVVFHGPNVMLGYAENRDDLALGDVQKGRLPTGDIGRLDEVGRLFLTGRAKRFGKVYGLRVNLDELEREASMIAPAAVIQIGEGVRVYLAADATEVEGAALLQRALDHLLACFTLPRASYEICNIGKIPRTERGKVDYVALEKLG
jgi:acyl-coenzyme A synthetase/AMP-(fatty) acid ligase